MAINFNVGDKVIVNQVFVQKSLSRQKSTPRLQQTLGNLGNLGTEFSQVITIGVLPIPDSGRFIRLLPSDTSTPAYNQGRGVTLFFSSDDDLNDSLELGTAYLKDKCFLKAINNTGVTIPVSSVVRQVGFSVTQQLAIIALADATTATNSVVLGVTQESIAAGACGSVVTAGSVIVDTSSYGIGDKVFLSDTPGAISPTVGTEELSLGRVLSVGVSGSISVFSTLLTGGGTTGETGVQGGTGIAGVTGIRGFTGIFGLQGDTGIQGVTGFYGNTGIAGLTGLALGATGIQGFQGDTGIAGFTGLALGSTGISGVTGLASGPQGATGIQGITGPTGPGGPSGPSGPSGPTGPTGPGFTSYYSTAVLRSVIAGGPAAFSTGFGTPGFSWKMGSAGANLAGTAIGHVGLYITSITGVGTAVLTVNGIEAAGLVPGQTVGINAEMAG